MIKRLYIWLWSLLPDKCEMPNCTRHGVRGIEFGLALGLEKRLVIIGPRENLFHTLPTVEVYPDLATFLGILHPPSVFAEDQ